MKYRKKPIEIEAIQFTNENKEYVYHWASEKQMNIEVSVEGDNIPCLIVPTLEGDMICSLGDYLIVEPFPTDWRKIYPCKEVIFNKTYEKADSETVRVVQSTLDAVNYITKHKNFATPLCNY